MKCKCYIESDMLKNKFVISREKYYFLEVFTNIDLCKYSIGTVEDGFVNLPAQFNLP